MARCWCLALSRAVCEVRPQLTYKISGLAHPHPALPQGSPKLSLILCLDTLVQIASPTELDRLSSHSFTSSDHKPMPAAYSSWKGSQGKQAEDLRSQGTRLMKKKKRKEGLPRRWHLSRNLRKRAEDVLGQEDSNVEALGLQGAVWL